MNRLNPDDPTHASVRSALRVAGPLIFILGLGLTVVGAGSLLSTMAGIGNHGGDDFPRYFWCIFPGMPLMWLGAVMSFGAYGSLLARYMAREMAPVQRDTFNTLAEGTSDGVRTMAQAVAEGLAAGQTKPTTTACPKCGQSAPAGSRFCPHCGQAVA